jgi:hypothetical protein
MIGKLVSALLGRKLKEKAVDAVLDKVDLPDPVEASIKAAATGNIGDLLADAADVVKAPAKKPKK